MIEHHDVIIVGAGPAGAATAFYLTERGISDVLILDRMVGEERYDRYHSICGEGISSRAFKDLAPIVPWHVRHHVHIAEMVWPGAVTIRRRIKGLILDRPLFLRELLRRAEAGGCHVQNGIVVSVHEGDERYHVTLRDGRSFTCRYLVGADGAFSVVRKQVFRTEPRRSIPVKQFLTDASMDPEKVIIHLAQKYQGCYRWEFPCGAHSNVGFPKDTDLVDGIVVENSRYLPFGGVPELIRGRVLLVGDAAAQANPVCFGGLRAAMTAAKNAARAVASDDPSIYSRWWSRSIISSPRFLRTHEKMRSWSDEDMKKAVAPFRKGVHIFSVARAVVSMPWNVPMYVAYLITFRYAW